MAHSIAVILKTLGECVSLLFMIDPLHLENLSQSSDIHQLPVSKVYERAIQLGDEYVYNFLQYPNESIVADYVQKLQIQMKLLVQYKSTFKHVTCPTRILLAAERIKKLDENTLMQPQTWDSVCSVEVLKVHKIPGKHSTCITSINCPHIVANLEIFHHSIDLEYPIPVISATEVVGSWSLSKFPWLDERHMTKRKTVDCELMLQQSRLLLNADGNYSCMIPKVVLELVSYS